MPRIRHLAIVSPNRERLVNFYTTAFDMRVVYGRPTSTHLSDGDFNLAIVDQKPDLKPGLYVLGFDVDDLQNLEGSLKKAGASSELTPMPKDHDAEFRVLDPDGNHLDLAIHGWCVV
jgi:catechol 2,3-dioxygenase-like lactoylglutathione lyase family enzyme